MNVSVPDVHQTLEYRSDTAIVRFLPDGLALCLLGLFVFALFDRPPADVVLAGCVVLAAGIALIAFALWRRSHPGRPRYVLSPMGVHYRLLTMILIPWREVRGIDTIDITSFNWSLRNPGTMTYHDVTAILVSKQFYDSHIHIDSFFMRGPAWENIFIPKGALIQIALHHELVSVEPRSLRKAVEARWHAFRGQAAGSASPATGDGTSVKRKRTSVPAVMAAWKRTFRRSDAAAHPGPPPGIAVGDNPRAMSPWRIAIIAVLLIGNAVALANLTGLWATSGQLAAREERRKSAEEDKRRKEETKRLEEEQRKTRERFEQMFRRM